MDASSKAGGMRGRVHALALALAAGAAQAAPADPPADPAAQAPVAAPAGQEAPPAPAADARPYKSYGAAALEILGFQFVLNRVDHAFVRPDDYGVTIGSIRRNLHSGWGEDRDPFEVNQLGHPYQGAVYFNLARSNGLTFWESMGYAFAGSAVWEVAGETTRPSRNDQITTSFGGSFLGESLYRMANLVLERGDGASEWREVGAALVSPPVGVNRQAGTTRRSTVLWPGASPATYARLQLGASNPSSSNVGPSLAQRRREVAADFALEYGLPGKDGYTYRKPFDYFQFRVRVSNVNGMESLASRGLLFGAPYGNDAVRGIFGLYGSYDYLSPQLFRIASTGLSLGSNAQWRITDGLALQGHASAGVGYTSTGTIRASSSGQYHYGVAPQALLTLRLIGGDRLALDVGARAFFDSRIATPETGGKDRVLRGDASLTYRIAGPHAVALKYITSRRAFSFQNVPERQQRYDSVGLYYSYQPGRGMGAVAW